MKKTEVKQPAKKLVFQIEQIAFAPSNTKDAMKLLKDMGIGDFVKDTVIAGGKVFGNDGWNKANLKFNYTALKKARELEVLEYTDGPNWIQSQPDCVSHIGMHCTADELVRWRKFFSKRQIAVVQEVMTQSHSNPVIKGKRWYNYCIFGTRSIIGVDVKFIVRRPTKGVL